MRSLGPTGYAALLITSLTIVVSLVVLAGYFLGQSLQLDVLGMSGVLVLSSLIVSLVLAAMFLTGSTVVQNLIRTYRSLFRLESLSHPLLTRLQKEAPGTYHHSIAVAHLAYEAAREIGANAVLTRVGGYYHDIGKVKNPTYFIENLVGKAKSPHASIAPQESAGIIIKHIIDGMDLARQYQIPKEVIQFIPEHAGTTLVYFFYQKAKQLQGGRGVYKRDFRYPGPKPMRKETALVMLADAVESLARAVKQPTKARLAEMVDEAVRIKHADRQLDLADLSDEDVAAIKESFIRTLQSMHHQRIAYPNPAQPIVKHARHAHAPR
ncbi:HDIG domain-containing protein [Candidatus Berkelbacteria bacterium]|nr:HDIG domain-containing protein [Candidatus Berkelbacteria bacterium]